MASASDLIHTLYTMAFMVEARDPYTGGHLWRVSQFSRLLAEAAGLSDAEIAKIAFGGFIHDLGKISVPDSILRKPDRLTAGEYDVIKTHPAVGMHILASHPLAPLVEDAIYAHHETPSGEGYPRGLSGDALPLMARIVSIADAFDAMTSTRPYRMGMPVARALTHIHDSLDKQFDEKLGMLFIDLGEKGALDEIVGHSEPGIPMQACPTCGPLITVSARHKHGDTVFCPACGHGSTLERQAENIRLSPSALKAAAADLSPVPDRDLMERLIEEIGPKLTI